MHAHICHIVYICCPCHAMSCHNNFHYEFTYVYQDLFICGETCEKLTKSTRKQINNDKSILPLFYGLSQVELWKRVVSSFSHVTIIGVRCDVNSSFCVSIVSYIAAHNDTFVICVSIGSILLRSVTSYAFGALIWSWLKTEMSIHKLPSNTCGVYYIFCVWKLQNNDGCSCISKIFLHDNGCVPAAI